MSRKALDILNLCRMHWCSRPVHRFAVHKQGWCVCSEIIVILQIDKGPKFLSAWSRNSHICRGKSPGEFHPNTLLISINKCILANALGFPSQSRETAKKQQSLVAIDLTFFSQCCSSGFPGYYSRALMCTSV